MTDNTSDGMAPQWRDSRLETLTPFQRCEMYEEEIAKLRAQLTRARGALRPFANAYYPIEDVVAVRDLHPLDKHCRLAAEVYKELG